MNSEAWHGSGRVMEDVSVGHFSKVAQVVVSFSVCAVRHGLISEKGLPADCRYPQYDRNRGIDVEIVACPIKRADGDLALSSLRIAFRKERAVAPGFTRHWGYKVSYYTRDYIVSGHT